MSIGRLISGAVALGALVMASSVAMAQSAADGWPNKPVKIIVNYAPGGSADNSTRPFTEPLTKMFGQPFVIDNRGGASGAIGMEAGAKAAPDGYTFVSTPGLTMAILPHLRKVNYDPFKDLVPVSYFAYYPMAFSVHPSVPAKDMKSFVAYVKANPGKLSFGSSGVGATGHLILEAFNRAAGTDILHVPYRGSSDALNDFLAGNVQVYADPTVQPHAAAGKAVLLAITGERRPEYPNIPAMKEFYPSVDYIGWSGLFAPAGTPDAIVRKMSEAMSKIAGQPEIKTALFGGGLFPVQAKPEDLAKIMRSDFDNYGKLIKETGIKME